MPAVGCVQLADQDDGHYTLCKCCGSFNNPAQASGQHQQQLQLSAGVVSRSMHIKPKQQQQQQSTIYIYHAF